MSRLLLALVVVSTVAVAQERREVGNVVLEGVPEVPAELAARLEQYENVRSARFLDWSAAGGMLVSTRFAETAQLHTVAGPGAMRRQLTFGDEPIRSAAFDPSNPNRILFVRDIGGGEFFQLWRLDLDTGRTTLLTDGRSRNSYPVFQKNTGVFAFVSTRRNGKDFDLYVQDIGRPNQARLVAKLEGMWVPLDWSDDNKTLLALRYLSITESELWTVDVASGRRVRINAGAKQPVSYGAALFDGASVLAASDEGSEFQRLVRYPLRAGALQVVADPGWDVEIVERSRGGKWLAWVANEGGTSAVYLAPLAEPTKTRRIELPPGVVSRMKFDREGARLGLSFNAGRSPEDAWSVDVATGKPTRWTFSEVGGLNPDTFVEPQLVSFESFDGRRIPAWLYLPKNAQGKLPVIVSIHGGPESQSKAWFSTAAQFWTNELGAAVLYPNVRGSSGYGKTYLKLDNAEKREDSVKDIGALLDWIAQQPNLDASRVGVIGGSYGGYMVLASLVRYGDRLACGVDVVGISHFVTFLEKTEAYRRDLRRVEYGDERDPEMRALLDSISPLTNASKINKPLFVAQGANDPRVPQAEAEQIVKTVRANGGEVWYLLARDEGHGFAKKRNRDLYFQATNLFFQQCLLGARQP